MCDARLSARAAEIKSNWLQIRSDAVKKEKRLSELIMRLRYQNFNTGGSRGGFFIQKRETEMPIHLS